MPSSPPFLCRYVPLCACPACSTKGAFRRKKVWAAHVCMPACVHASPMHASPLCTCPLQVRVEDPLLVVAHAGDLEDLGKPRGGRGVVSAEAITGSDSSRQTAPLAFFALSRQVQCARCRRPGGGRWRGLGGPSATETALEDPLLRRHCHRRRGLRAVRQARWGCWIAGRLWAFERRSGHFSSFEQKRLNKKQQKLRKPRTTQKNT
jgi:hypothetical protein